MEIMSPRNSNLLINALNINESANCASNPRHALRVAAGEALLIRGQGLTGDNLLMDQAFSLKVMLQAALRKHTISSLGREFEIEVGFALLPESTIFERERVFHEAVGDARRMANGGIDLEAVKLSSIFRSIIRNGQIRMLFQPIYDFKTGTVMAWEALARGPRGSEFESPAILFDFAEQFGQLFALEQACRAKAMETVGALTSGQRLF